MSTVTVIDILQKAKEHLKAKGWIQGRYGYSNGAACLVGALMAVSDEGEFDFLLEAENLLSEFIPAKYHRHLTKWNDIPSRRKSQVIALLDKAIAKAQAQQPSQP